MSELFPPEPPKPIVYERYVGLIKGEYSRGLVLLFESPEQAHKHVQIMGHTLLDLQKVVLTDTTLKQ